MTVNERPTCVTVIGWAWIVIGGLMCFSALMGIFMSLSMQQMMRTHPHMDQEVPAFFRYFALIALGQVAVGALGLAAGINFLRLAEWARKVLLVVTTLLFLFVVGFGVFWVITWVGMSSGHGPPGFAAMGLIMGVFNTALFGVPLGIMTKYLAGDRVKQAMKAPVSLPNGPASTPDQGGAGGGE